MEFIGVKELSQKTSSFVRKRDWVVITKNGRPVKIMIDIDADDLEDLILAKHYHLEGGLKRAVQDAQKGSLKTLEQVLRHTRPKSA